MHDKFSLEGKHALVTGASGGLGAHFARVLCQSGATVTIAARRCEALEAQASEIRDGGHRVHTVAMDVTVRDSIEAAFNAAQAAAGPVDILINNAGIATTKRAVELTDAEFDSVFDTNLKGAWVVAQCFVQRLIETRKSGAIVNIASILGERVMAGVLAYTTAKAALVQMTKALALEWARHDIRVNALAPGYIETDINREFLASEAGQSIAKRIPQRRFGKPQDLDGALLLLASDAGAFMTGAVVAVDGGHLVSSL